MDPRRVARIGYQRSLALGSGYFLSDSLVLTAKHCLAPKDKKDTCLVQPLGGGQPLKAKTLWTDDLLDVALLQTLEAKGCCGLAPHPAQFGKVPITTLDSCRVVGRGFPSAQVLDGEQGDYQVSGVLAWAHAFKHFDLQLTSPVPYQDTDDGSGWGGLSGAAVFADRMLLGLVLSYPVNFKGSVLQVLPIARLFETPDFQRHVSSATLKDWGSNRDLKESVTPLLNHIDRSRQVGDVERAAQPLLTRRQGRPMRFVIDCKAEDEPQRLMERLAGAPLLQALLGDAQATETITALEWPRSTHIDPNEEWALMLEALASQLGAPPGEEATPANVRKWLDGQPRGRAFWQLIQSSGAGRGHGALLAQWLDFWRQVDALGDGVPALLFLCLMYDGEPAAERRFFAPRRGPPGPELMDVLHDAEAYGMSWIEPLGQIVRIVDVPAWIKELIRRCPQIEPGLFRTFEDSLNTRLPGERISMKTFCDNATATLEAL